MREATPRGRWFGRSWGLAQRWWGAGLDQRPLEVDVVAESMDGAAILVGEVKWSDGVDTRRVLAELEGKAARLPAANGREVQLGVWTKGRRRAAAGSRVFGPGDVLAVLGGE